MRAKYICAAMGFLCLLFVSCSKLPEMTLEEIQLHSQNLNESLFQKTISKPWTGGEYKAGNVSYGGAGNLLGKFKGRGSSVSKSTSASDDLIISIFNCRIYLDLFNIKC